MATMQTRSGPSSRLVRNYDNTRQNPHHQRQQQQQQTGAGHAYSRQGEARNTDGHQAAFLNGYYNERGSAAAGGSAAQESLSSSSTPSSTPRKLLQNRRQNMMQRRIEMRQKTEERQRQQQQQQQQQQPNGCLSAPQIQSQTNESNFRHQQAQQAASLSQSQPQQFVQRQAQHAGFPQNGGRQPNNVSLLKRHNNEMQQQRSSGQWNANQRQPSQDYPISSQPNEQRPPSHPYSSAGVQQRPRQNFYPRTQPQHQNISYAQKQQHQSSPLMQSPPVLDRKQNAPQTMFKGDYPSTNLFHNSRIHTSSPKQYFDDNGEGIEVEAKQVSQNSISIFNQKRASHAPSPKESPSDEILVEDGYFEDESQPQLKANSSYEQQMQSERTAAYSASQSQHMKAMVYEQQRQSLRPASNSNHMHQQAPRQQHQQNMQQQMSYNKHNSQPQQAPIDEMNQPQPDWHQLNRNRLYQKKFAVRYQNAATNSSPKFQSQNQTLPPRLSPTKQPNVSNFSPVESLSNRNDQIQRKQRQPSHNNRAYNVTDSFEVMPNDPDLRQNQPDECEDSVASVLDRARSFEANYARKYSGANGDLRSKSVPRERAQNIANAYQNHYEDDSVVGRRRSPRLSYQESYKDDDTATESVQSRKKEWEGKFQSGQRRQRQMKPPPENEAFGVWSERANRLAQQRLSEQKKQQKEQRKSIEEKWRRSAAKSMSPGRQRGKQDGQQYDYYPSYAEEAEFSDEYFISKRSLSRQSDQGSMEQESSHRSIEDRRRMLWDGKERLRTAMPRSSSFDSTTKPPGSCSPGSCSQGSSFFKSKYFRAAAAAANENPAQRASSKSQSPKTGAVSSHYTDSTAGTTPVESNGSSYSVSQRVDQYRKQSAEPTQMTSENSNARTSQPSSKPNTDEGASPSNKVSVMPPIAEAPRSSVADLIARINAVSRSDPAEALAAIDSIIKAESGQSQSPKISRPKLVKPAQSPFSPRRPSADKQAQPLGKDFFQSKFEEVVQETEKKEEEESSDESYLSSDDSTVSSMTNPTYQSIPVHNRSPSPNLRGGKKHPNFSPPVLEEFDVKTSKGARKSPPLPPQSTQGALSRTSNPFSNRLRQGDIVVSKPSSDAPEDTGNRRFVETTIGGLNYRLSTSKSEEQTPWKNTSNNAKPNSHQSAKTHDEKLDSAWVPVPSNDFFQTTRGKFTKDKQTNGLRQIVPESKPSKDSSVNESTYISNSELSQGQAGGLPSVVSDAFSGIDIDMDDEPVPNPVQQPQHHSTTSQAFAKVDIDLEPKKSVRQRRQELEYLSKSWTKKSPTSAEDEATKSQASPGKQINTRVSNLKASNNDYDWTLTPEEDKKKVKAEPAMRLKGSKKLAQKFASLVKAFESDI